MNELGSKDSGSVFRVTENGEGPLPISETNKKEFVEPEVSWPEDVLQCTTFFQLADSGATT